MVWIEDYPKKALSPYSYDGVVLYDEYADKFYCSKTGKEVKINESNES